MIEVANPTIRCKCGSEAPFEARTALETAKWVREHLPHGGMSTGASWTASEGEFDGPEWSKKWDMIDALAKDIQTQSETGSIILESIKAFAANPEPPPSSSTSLFDVSPENLVSAAQSLGVDPEALVATGCHVLLDMDPDCDVTLLRDSASDDDRWAILIVRNPDVVRQVIQMHDGLPEEIVKSGDEQPVEHFHDHTAEEGEPN